MDSTWFSNVNIAPAIEVFKLTELFKADPHPHKVNLGVGAYRDDDSKPWVLPVVSNVEKQMAEDQTLNHEYLPVAGNEDFRRAAMELILGEDSPALLQMRADSVQCLGGTGALFIGLSFLRKELKFERVYVSTPTWGNHKGISTSLGYSVFEYRYWDEARKKLDIDGMLADIRAAPEKSVFLLHACCHNPTGVDPSKEQWIQIAAALREKNQFVFFDCAYQGFSTGNLEDDSRAVQYFVNQGFEMFIAQSFSKNFGLYNERVGNLCFVTNNKDSINKIRTQMVLIIRKAYSNPSNHGSRIVATILKGSALRVEWKEHVKAMADRILLMRQQLFDKLREQGTPGTWDHITEQKGMFSYTGLSQNQVTQLIENHHIYLLGSGRINMCGLTSKNIDYVAKAIHDVVVNIAADAPKL